jgi:hypothetical protein
MRAQRVIESAEGHQHKAEHDRNEDAEIHEASLLNTPAF